MAFAAPGHHVAFAAGFMQPVEADLAEAVLAAADAQAAADAAEAPWRVLSAVAAAKHLEVDRQQLILASYDGDESRMEALLSASADPWGLVMGAGEKAIMAAVLGGKKGAVQLLLGHPELNAAAMIAARPNDQRISMVAATCGDVGCMELVLDACDDDTLLACDLDGDSALVYAAWFAVQGHPDPDQHRGPSWDPLLFMLRRFRAATGGAQVLVEQIPRVMRVLDAVLRAADAANGGLDPDDARDECMLVLIEFGAPRAAAAAVNALFQKLERVSHELAELRRTPQLINDATVSMALERERRAQLVGEGQSRKRRFAWAWGAAR